MLWENRANDENFDPCAKIKWIHDIAEGEEIYSEGESTLVSETELLDPEFDSHRSIEEACGMQEQDIPYI